MKKNNRGYTLIELLVVLALLAVILMLLAPSVVNIVVDFSDKKYKDIVEKNAISGAKLYFSDQKYNEEINEQISNICDSNSSGNGKIVVSVQTLIYENYFDTSKLSKDDIIDINGNVNVTYDCTKKNFDNYKYQDSTIDNGKDEDGNEKTALLGGNYAFSSTTNSITSRFKIKFKDDKNDKVNYSKSYCMTDNSHKGTVKYNDDGKYYECTINELTDNTKYTINIFVFTTEQFSKTFKGEYSTSIINSPKINNGEQLCNDTSLIKIMHYDYSNIDDPIYYFRYVSGNITFNGNVSDCGTKISELNCSYQVLIGSAFVPEHIYKIVYPITADYRIDFDGEGTIVPIISDGYNKAQAKACMISQSSYDNNLANYKPTALKINNSYTNGFNVSYTKAQIDTEKNCSYTYTIKDNSNNILNNNCNGTCLINNLTQSKDYNLNVCTELNACSSNTTGKTKELKNITGSVDECTPATINVNNNNTEMLPDSNSGVFVKLETSLGISNKNAYKCSSNTASSCTNTIVNAGNNLSVNTWYYIKEKEASISLNSAGTIVYFVSDGINNSSAFSYTATNSDISKFAPSINNLVLTTNSAEFNFSLPGISCSNVSYTCQAKNGSNIINGSINGSKCTFENLESSKEYKFSLISSYNGKKIESNILTGNTASISSPSYAFTEFTSSSVILNLNYDTKKNINAYYVKPDHNISLTSGTASSCGTSNISSCSGSTTSLSANTWYKLSSNNVKFNVTSIPGNRLILNTITSDGNNNKEVNLSLYIPFMVYSDKNENRLVAKNGTVTLPNNGYYLFLLWGGKGGNGLKDERGYVAFGGNSGFVYGYKEMMSSETFTYSLGGNGGNSDSIQSDNNQYVNYSTSNYYSNADLRIKAGANNSSGHGGFMYSIEKDKNKTDCKTKIGSKCIIYNHNYTYKFGFKYNGASGGGYSILNFGKDSTFGDDTILLSGGGGGATYKTYGIGYDCDLTNDKKCHPANGGSGGSITNNSTSITNGVVFSGQDGLSGYCGISCNKTYKDVYYGRVYSGGGGYLTGGTPGQPYVGDKATTTDVSGKKLDGGTATYAISYRNLVGLVSTDDSLGKGLSGSAAGGGGAGYYGGAGGFSHKTNVIGQCYNNADSGCTGGGGGGSSFISSKINYADVNSNSVMNYIVRNASNPSTTGGGIIVYYLGENLPS